MTDQEQPQTPPASQLQQTEPESQDALSSSEKDEKKGRFSGVEHLLEALREKLGGQHAVLESDHLEPVLNDLKNEGVADPDPAEVQARVVQKSSGL